jgi:hypothetical protein
MGVSYDKRARKGTCRLEWKRQELALTRSILIAPEAATLHEQLYDDLYSTSHHRVPAPIGSMMYFLYLSMPIPLIHYPSLCYRPHKKIARSPFISLSPIHMSH